MREIRPSGSEGGAVMSRPYPYRSEPKSTTLFIEGERFTFVSAGDLPADHHCLSELFTNIIPAILDLHPGKTLLQEPMSRPFTI